MKIFSIFLAIREMQIKTTLRFQLTQSEWVTQMTTNAGKYAEQGTITQSW
jgi:hypothetical protein